MDKPSREEKMQRLSLVIWIILAPVLMGSFVLSVLTVPGLASQEMKLMLPAAIAGAVVAIPFSYIISRSIQAKTKKS